MQVRAGEECGGRVGRGVRAAARGVREEVCRRRRGARGQQRTLRDDLRRQAAPQPHRQQQRLWQQTDAALLFEPSILHQIPVLHNFKPDRATLDKPFSSYINTVHVGMETGEQQAAGEQERE